MKFTDIKVDDLKTIVFTTIDLVVKPLDALTIKANEVLSKHVGGSGVCYWDRLGGMEAEAVK